MVRFAQLQDAVRYIIEQLAAETLVTREQVDVIAQLRVRNETLEVSLPVPPLHALKGLSWAERRDIRLRTPFS